MDPRLTRGAGCCRLGVPARWVPIDRLSRRIEDAVAIVNLAKRDDNDAPARPLRGADLGASEAVVPAVRAA